MPQTKIGEDYPSLMATTPCSSDNTANANANTGNDDQSVYLYIKCMTGLVIILLSCFVCETTETFLPLLLLLWLCVSVKSIKQSTTQNSGRAVKDYHANATCNLVSPSASHQSHSICVVAGRTTSNTDWISTPFWTRQLSWFQGST
jgi:hypothetical protein